MLESHIFNINGIYLFKEKSLSLYYKAKAKQGWVYMTNPNPKD